MMMNLMTILVKKVFISSKPTFVYLLCPPLCGPFSIQESAAGGLSYKVKKNVPWHILAPRAVACDNLHLRASAHLWHVSAFLCNREFLGISCYIKKVPDIVFTMPGRNCSWCHPISQISLPRKPTAPCLRHSHSCRLHS